VIAMSKSPSKIVGRSLIWGLVGKAAFQAYKMHRRRRAGRAAQADHPH
jgi:hypothetical protein